MKFADSEEVSTPTPVSTSRHAALSPSRVKELRQCPLKFRLRTINRIVEQPSQSALRGTLVHRVLERLFTLPQGERTEDEAEALLKSSWEELCESPIHDTEIFESDREFEEWYASARPLISAYFRLENPNYLVPIGMERFVEAVLPSGLAIRGVIDRLDKSPTGQLRVVDYKTGKSPNPRFQNDYIFQMRFYATALQFAEGILPMRTQLLFLKDARTLTYDPPAESVDKTVRELEDAWEEIEHRCETGQFLPRESPLCNWCNLQHLCPAKGGEPPEISREGVEYLKTAIRPLP